MCGVFWGASTILAPVNTFYKHFSGKEAFLADLVHEIGHLTRAHLHASLVPESVRDYYNAFEHGYLARLTVYPQSERQLVANFLVGLSHYLGIEVLFQNSVTDVEGVVRGLGALLTTGIPR